MELQYRGSGKAYINESEYQCNLYLNKQQGGILLNIEVKNEEPMGDFLKVPLEFPYLCCQLENGFKFTLLRLRRTRMNNYLSYGVTVFTFNAEYMLCGVIGKGYCAQTFYKVNFTLSDIVEWGEESIFTIGEQVESISKGSEIQKTLFNGQGFCIKYIVRGSMFPVIDQELLKEHIDIEQHGMVEISFETEEKFERYIEIFEKLKRLIEVASFKKVNVEKVSAYSTDIVYDIGNRNIERPIEVYGKDIQEYTPDVPAQNHSRKWICLPELIAKGSFDRYFDKYSTLTPIIELFLEPFHVEYSSETRVFLNIVQALETYHSRFVTNRFATFKKRVERFANVFPPDKAEELRKFLMANSKSFISLESRLADLLFASGKICFDTGEIKHKEFPAVIANTRNYYIHYDERIKAKHRVLSEEELQFYNHSLLQMLEYYILSELGFSDINEIQTKLTERWGSVSQKLEVLRKSRVQNISQ